MPEERRIIVEVVSHADVKRLEDRDEALREEVRKLTSRVDGLQRRIFELMEALGELRRRK